VDFAIGLIVRLAITAAAFGITAWILSGMDLSGGFFGYLWVALLFGLVNAVIGTIVRLVTLPFMLLTLGLLAIVVNALMLELTDALTDNLTIDEFFWTAIWASIILSVVTVVLQVAVSAFFGRNEAEAPRSVPA
jgi:putative membrane protein